MAGEQLLRLPDGLAATLAHCGRPMEFRSSHTSWTGKPGEGTERHENRYGCAGCTTTVTLTVVEEC